MLARFNRWIVRHYVVVLTVVAVMTALAAIPATRVRFDFSPQVVHETGDDSVEFAEQFKKTFGYEDAVLMLIVESTGDRDVLDAPSLTWQIEAAKRFAQLPGVSAVQSVATLEIPQFSLSVTDEVKLAPVIDRLPIDSTSVNQLRRLVSESRMLEGTLVSADRRAGSMIVVISPDRRDADAMRGVVESVESTLAQLPPPEGYQVHVGGLPALRVEIVRSLEADQSWLLPMGALVFVGVLGFLFRRVSTIVVPLLAAAVGLTWMLAFMTLTSQTFNIMSNVLPVMMLIVGISNCVHIICRYAEETQIAGGNRRQAMERTMYRLSAAFLLTFLTTVVGFGSILTARSDVLRSFAAQSAVGISLLYVSFVTIAPCVIPFFKVPKFRGPTPVGTSPPIRWIARTGYAVALHPMRTLALSTLVLGCAGWLARDVVVNSSMFETFNEGHPTMQTMRIIENQLGGMLPVEVALAADGPGRLLEPDTYRKVAEFQKFALAQECVLFARSYVNLHQEVYARFRNNQSLYDEIPADNAELDFRIRRSSNLIGRAGSAMHYETFMAPDGRQARILVRVCNEGTRRLLPTIDVLENKLAELFPPGSGVTFRLTGDAVLNGRAIDLFIRDLFTSLLTATVTIFAVIAIVFRSLRLGLIAAVPNLIPMILTLGYIGLRGYDLNAENVIVFSISLGITVDNTIQYLNRFREEIRHEPDLPRAIQRTFECTGRAMISTTFLIDFGLAVLLFSSFLPTRRFAELTSVTIAAALLGNVFLLPICLVKFWNEMPEPTSAEKDVPRVAQLKV